MSPEAFWVTLLGMALVTYLPRALGLVGLSGRALPQTVERWLGYIPAAVLAALLAPALSGEGEADRLLAALPTFLVAVLSRNMALTVVVGILSMTVVKALAG